MGTFFFLTAVRTSAHDDVQRALVDVVQGQGLRITREKPANYEDSIGIAPQQGAWTCIQYQQAGLDWRKVSGELSARLKSPTFFFQIYDGDVWGYWFFEQGQEMGKFVSMPAVYDEATDRPEEWEGNIKEVCARLGIKAADLLGKYLIHLEPENPPSNKVHPKDEFEVSDPWVVSDFMQKLGILWEDKEGKGTTLYVVKK